MALSKGNEILWSDISAIFTRISTQRKKFGYSTVSASSYGSVGTKATAQLVQNMSNLLNEIKGQSKAFAAVTKYTIAVPAVGSYIVPAPFITMQDMLTTLENTCMHFTNFGDFGDFSFDFSWQSHDGSLQSHQNHDGALKSHDGHDGGYQSHDSGDGCTYFNSSFTFNSFSCNPYYLPG